MTGWGREPKPHRRAAVRHRDISSEVTFERGPAGRFDLVVGADGPHSNVRRLVFGPESIDRRLPRRKSVPNHLGLDGRMESILGVGLMVGMYGTARMDDARAVSAAKQLVPGSALDLWTLAQGARLIGHLPTGLVRAVSKRRSPRPTTCLWLTPKPLSR
ncbi:hypothetical protein [Nonomuraea jabiensis]|uniref:hypothetical protein n=1 Tax=Nonomuraea jabiensis TaxID=882448 RepID=UPI003D752EE1